MLVCLYGVWICTGVTLVASCHEGTGNGNRQSPLQEPQVLFTDEPSLQSHPATTSFFEKRSHTAQAGYKVAEASLELLLVNLTSM